MDSRWRAVATTTPTNLVTSLTSRPSPPALAATVGIGNIAGAALAIHYGGPGALFWMWMTALLGMATKFAEVTLARSTAS